MHLQATKAATVRPIDFQTEEARCLVVNSILKHPAIYSRISHDHRSAGYISHPDVSYLGAYVDGALVGVFTVIESGYIETDLHAAILPSALKRSRDLGRACLSHVFKRDPGVARVTAQVIGDLQSAVNYCKRLGFKHEGARRDACMRNGKLTDVIVMGMTRADWEAMQ